MQTLRVSLEDARANGDRLHRESELVVENVNSWVKEQKYVPPDPMISRVKYMLFCFVHLLFHFFSPGKVTRGLPADSGKFETFLLASVKLIAAVKLINLVQSRSIGLLDCSSLTDERTNCPNLPAQKIMHIFCGKCNTHYVIEFLRLTEC